MKSKHSNGVKLDVVLTLIFIVLKFVGVIDWSWIWVLSPLWLTVVLIVFLAIIKTLLHK